jgi:Protein of unknown function (DUF732)
MIDLGKAVCRAIRSGGTIYAVDQAIGGLTRAGFPQMDRAVILTSAANNMCPDTWPAINAHTQAVRN